MKLSNFEKYVDEVIVERGKNYFRRGHVKAIDEIVENEYLVEVKGSEYYTVEINLTYPDMFVDTYCNCPFDWGKYCKHQAAALFALRRYRELKTYEIRTDLKTMVSNLTKEELIDILLNLSKLYPRVRRELMSSYSSPKNKKLNNKDI